MKAKAWEGEIHLWSQLRDASLWTIWQWELWLSSRQSIVIQCSNEYKTEQHARAAARRAMKRLGLVEKAK